MGLARGRFQRNPLRGTPPWGAAPTRSAQLQPRSDHVREPPRPWGPRPRRPSAPLRARSSKPRKPPRRKAMSTPGRPTLCFAKCSWLPRGLGGRSGDRVERSGQAVDLDHDVATRRFRREQRDVLDVDDAVELTDAVEELRYLVELALKRETHRNPREEFLHD